MRNRWVVPILLAAVAAATVAATARAQDATGRVDIYAFGPDGALEGLEAKTGTRGARTGRDGVAHLSLPVGEHELVFTHGKREVARRRAQVAAGGVTEVVVRVAATGEARIDVEAPAWPKIADGPPLEEGAARGTLAGIVVDAATKAPIAGALVVLRGQTVDAQSDAQGEFVLANIAAGTHLIAVSHPRYATRTMGAITVPADGRANVTVDLTSSSVELDAIQVTGHDIEGGLASLLDKRRTDHSLLEVVGADQIAKSGDSNAAEALQRLSGLTVVGGRYVYVRGMGERYSSALLNGASLPSPDPERRVVPLDLFPAGAIESLSVQKTFSPDMPGEFGGGVTQIKTRGIPDRFNSSLSVSSAWNDASTFRRGLRGHAGAWDWAGFDDGTRNLPPAVITASAHRPLHLSDSISNDGYSLPVLTALGQTMPNNWSARRRSSLAPDVGLTGSLGDRFELGPGAIGYSAGVSYDHKFRNRRGVNRVFGLGANNKLEPITDYKTNLTRRTVDMSGLATVGYQPVKGQEVAVTTLVTRSTEDEAEIYGGYLANEDRQIRLTSLNFVEEQLIATQLRGRHALFAGVELDWRYTFANATRDQPDWRRSRYDLDPSLRQWLLSNRPEGNQRLYNKVNDDNHDVAAGLDFPIPVWPKLTAHLKTGGGYIVRDREADTRRFKFIHRGPVSRDPQVLAQTPERVFSKQNISPDGFSFEEITRATDNYEADQTIAAGFVNGIVPVHESIDLSLGVRVERSRQRVATFDLFSHAPTSQKADLDNTDYLPAAGLVWRFREDMQLRLAYGHTLSRPDFRELSAAPYDQVVGAGVFMGNPKLERATIDNFDLRWEWYLSRDEQMSIGLFYKDLRHPIETVIRGGANRTITLENAPRGRNYGLEVESRKRLGFLDDVLDPLFLGWNLALIKSEVKLDKTGVGTNKKRPLAGQSGFVVNASFGWDDPDTRTAAAILYNVSAQRLVGVGTFGLPDIYEQPFHKLDLVLSWGFLENLTVKVQVDNLLGWRQTFTQDGKITERYEVGRTVSLSLSGQF